MPGVIEVTYGSPDAAARIDDAAASLDAAPAGELRLRNAGLAVRLLRVDPARASQTLARLRATAGVGSAELVQYRHLEASAAVNDPYYVGYGAGAPFFESAAQPGQWDMHVMNVAGAWAHYAHLPAVGAPIAIIDTGVDVSHPDLAGGKVIRQRCFVTYPSSAAQTTGNFAVDSDGHGTNVAGIADADTDNAFGFAGVAFDAPLLAYRIFPSTPSGGCVGSSNAQCSSTDIDEATAIDDAVGSGAKVINLSLGAPGPGCTDNVEKSAVESAIARGVVVVAAAGNETKNALDCPAAYPGVIAVGADGLSGSANTEVVASYSNWTGASGPGGGGAYLVAPGGTASSDKDSDDLHWIENITSSEQSGAAGYCTTDFSGKSGDCRAAFAGTSQATPHVAGVVSLMLGLRPALSPAQIAADLCSTAQRIGDSKQGCGRVNAAAAVAKALTQ